MAPPSVGRLLALAGTGSPSLSEVFSLSTPGLGFLRAFFATWLKLDLTTLAAALTIFGTLNGALRIVKGLALKLYWWFTKFFTASISIAGSDRLNKEIVNWLGARITMEGTRILTARTESIQNDAWNPRKVVTERNDYLHEKRVPIQYLPTFGTTWFIHDRNIFLVQRIPSTQGAHMSRSMAMPQEYVAAPEGDEPLVIMCLGRSVKPIKRFLHTCRDFAEQQRESFITVRASKSQFHHNAWDTTILRPIRPLETVHFDEITKNELVADIKNYLDPVTRRFYIARGIPYRRGYLLHGTPGTGKTSLSLALAGYFGLELYLCHLPSVREDNELERLFTALPPRCLVLLEDIDAVGVSRQPDKKKENDDDDEDDDEEEEEKFNPHRSRCTLSGVLNVLDGVASQEGRIVLMTSNHADRLDKALVRPGRIDKMIFLGNISHRSAELMFLRMYAPDHTQGSTSSSISDLQDGELEKLALKFSSQIPDDTFTPAQLQGYLLNRRNSPTTATGEVATWVEEEKAIMEEAKLRAKETRKWRAKKRKEQTMKFLKGHGIDVGLAKDLAGIENSRLAARIAAVEGDDKGEGKYVPANANEEANREVKEGVPAASETDKNEEARENVSVIMEEKTNRVTKRERPVATEGEQVGQGTNSEEIVVNAEKEQIEGQKNVGYSLGATDAKEESITVEDTGLDSIGN